MKKNIVVVSLLSLYFLFSCNSLNNTSTSNDTSSSIESISSIVSESVSQKKLLNECNFIMDLSLYSEKDITYNYFNEFGSGKVETNLIYISCEFIFIDDYELDTSFELNINDQNVELISLLLDQNKIIFKIEDPNWSNIY